MNRTKKQILEKIKNNEIKMVPKWKFVVWEDLKVGISVIGLLVTTVTAGILVYWGYINEPWKLTQFGVVGWEIIWDLFPKIILGLMVMLIGVSIVALGAVGENYKKPVYQLSTMAALIVLGLTIILAIMGKIWEAELLFRLI